MAETGTGWDQRKFEEALREYVKVTSRTLPVVINTKAYYIARKALWNMAKADPRAIIRDLGGIMKVAAVNKRGKTVKRSVTFLQQGHYHDAPLAALIVNARLGEKGEKGLYGRAMERAVRQLLGARSRSVAFLKSGWIPSIKILGPLSDRKGQPEIDREARQIGRAKGTARAAKPGNQVVAEIVNLATTQRDVKGALLKYGQPALEEAFRSETASMWDYINFKMRPATDAFNASQK